MSRIEPIAMDAATGKAKELLGELATRGGEPTSTDASWSASISRFTSGWAASTAWSRIPGAARQLGLTDTDIELARQGTATEPKVAAMVAYGRQVIVAPGEVTDAQIDELRAHGYTDEQIAEVVGLVSLQLLTGGLNLVAGVEPTPEDLHELTSRKAA